MNQGGRGRGPPGRGRGGRMDHYGPNGRGNMTYGGRGGNFGPGRGPPGRGGRDFGGRGMMGGGRMGGGRDYFNGPHHGRGGGPPMNMGPAGRGPPGRFMNGPSQDRGNFGRGDMGPRGPPMDGRGPMMMGRGGGHGPPMRGNMNGPPIMMGQPPQHMNMNPQMHQQMAPPPPPPLMPHQQFNQQPNMMQPNNMMMRPPPPPMQQPPPPMFGQQGFAPQPPQIQQNISHPPPPIINQQFQQPQPPPRMLMQPQQPGMPPQILQQPQQNVMVQQSTQQQPPPKSNDANTAWTEHKSPTGISYYYNTVTKVSTYEKPVALGGSGSSSSSTSPTKQAAASNKSKWQTYTDESSGKKYYSDGVTTTWVRPSILPPEDDTTTTSNKKQKRTSFEEAERKLKKKKLESNTDNTTSLYSNKAEAIAAFKGLLLAKDIAPTTKWADVVRICSDDARWQACSTIGERKQALAEYQTKRANELRDVKRQEKVRAKEAFLRLLTDVLSDSSSFTPGTSRFADVRDSLLSKDDRFHVVEDESTREELYYEWVEELRKKEERTKRNKKREAKENCGLFLKGKEDEGKLSFASTWSSFVSSLDETEKADARFATSINMSETDRQLYFSDYVIDLQNQEDEKRRRIRDARRRAEKAQRDAFRERLGELSKAGVLTPEARWRGFEEKVSNDPTYEPVQAQGRDVARELFEDFVYDWKEKYRRDKVTLVRVWEMSKKEFAFDDENEEKFGKMLLEACAGSPDLYGEIRRITNREDTLFLSSVSLFYNELKSDSEVAKNGNGKDGDESSEDEGEIIEDGEVDG